MPYYHNRTLGAAGPVFEAKTIHHRAYNPLMHYLTSRVCVQAAVAPPSMGKATPVIDFAISEERKSAI
jgi:hypothetical protein